jgi:hypothetical protein
MCPPDEQSFKEGHPGQLSPVDTTNANVPDCLRFSRAEVDRSLEENSWARFGWNAARHADGYVVASVASVASIASVPSVPSMNNPREHPFETLARVSRERLQQLARERLQQLAHQRDQREQEQQELPAAGAAGGAAAGAAAIGREGTERSVGRSHVWKESSLLNWGRAK